MQGTIVLINRKRGLAAVLTENGEFTTFEILGAYDIDLGDIVAGDMEELDHKSWRNVTKNEEIDVFVEDIYGTKENAIRLIS